MADVLIVGCGYTGRRLGLRLLDEGHRVVGTTRCRSKAAALEEAGVHPRILDVTVPESVRELASAAPDVCFYLAPPASRESGGETGPGGGGDAGVEAVLRALRRAPMEAFVYVSSTSVYGDRGGEWVDESDPPRPGGRTGRARLEAERTVLRVGAAHDARPRIVRPAGIYGPGRTLRRRIEEGRYHLVEGVEAFSNRVHVEDLVTALVASWRRGSPGRLYNACDDRPHPTSEYGRLHAEALGVELPRISLPEARERYSEKRLARKLASKRVSNHRLREELGVELRYPTVAEGVPAALAEEGE